MKNSNDTIWDRTSDLPMNATIRMENLEGVGQLGESGNRWENVKIDLGK